MLIAQITDLHVAEEGSPMRAFVDANAKLEAAVRFLNDQTPQVDAVIATGDLTDHGTPEQYGLLTEILSGLRAPVFVIPGNHDERGPIRAAFVNADYLPKDGKLRYTVDDFPVRLVALDSTRDGHHEGELDGDDLAWLDDMLTARRDVPTLVFLHHPPFATGIWWMDCIGLGDAAELRSLVAKHPQVVRVVAGHLHRPITTAWGHAVVTTAPSTTHQVCCNLDPDHDPVLAAEPPMLDLHWWTGDAFVSHSTVFEPVKERIEIAKTVSDWQSAKARIREGPPFTKDGVFG